MPAPNPINPELEHGFFKDLDAAFPDTLPTYEQFVRYLGWLSDDPLLRGQSLDDLAATGNLVYVRYIWHRAGRPTYELRPALLQALRDTQIPEDFLVEEIRPPYEGIRILLQKHAIEEQPGIFPESIYMTYVREEGLCRVIGDSRAADTVFHTKIAVRPETTIDQAIRYTIDHCSFSEVERTPEEMRKFFQDSPTFKLTVNLILYLVCPEADFFEEQGTIQRLHQKLQGLPKGHRREMIEDQLRKTKAAGKTYIVGASFRPEPPEEISNLTEGGKKWMLQKRIRVPGFWRWQPHGPKMSLRRRQFIEPHWRGPTFAEMVERGFVVR